MKPLNDQEIERYIKQALEKNPSIHPTFTSEEMWKKIKEREKQKKQRTHLRKIPVYGSSFIAIVAMVFLFLEVPKTSDHFVVQNEKSMADMDRAYEEIQNATTFMKENDETLRITTDEKQLKEYPTYVPDGYVLVKEETLERGNVYYYENEGKSLVLQKLYGGQTPKLFKNSSHRHVQQPFEEGILLISGDLSEEELTKILDSIH